MVQRRVNLRVTIQKYADLMMSRDITGLRVGTIKGDEVSTIDLRLILREHELRCSTKGVDILVETRVGFGEKENGYSAVIMVESVGMC